MLSLPLDLSLEIQPYPGLRPFREDETHLYFGREQHRGELLKRLAVTRFVAVVGTSGSGKSSLVRAGLLPDLLSGYLASSGCDWVIVESRPGADPLGNLAIALVTAGWSTDAAALRTNSSHLLDLAGRHLTPGQHLLVLVDQFEELFRLTTSEDPAEDADEKAAFVRLLLNAGGQRVDVTAQHPCVHVVIAMRSEFLGRASVYRGLPEAIDQGQYLIPRLSRDQLRKAIECPARVAGGEVEEALVQRQLNELGDDQDQLPVLQHALMRCWQYRPAHNRIGLEAYEKSGQLASALSMDANEALAETRQVMGVRGEQIVTRAFQALRETDVNGGQTRRPTTVQVLCELAGCTTDELVNALAPFRVRSFIVPSPDTLLDSSTPLDISHEALLRRWDALRRWIDEDNLDRARYVRLATRAAEEQDSERPQYLVPPQLDLLVKFWADRNPPKAWAVRHHKGFERAKAFLEESERHRRALEQEEADRQAEESRRKQAFADAVANRVRIRKRAITGLGLAVTLLVIGGLVLRNSLAQSAHLEAQGSRLQVALLAAKLASVPEANVKARLQLAAEVVRRWQDLESQDLESQNELLKALFIAPLPKDVGWGSKLEQNVTSVAISSNNQRLYAVAGDRLHVIELASGTELPSMLLSSYAGYRDSRSAPFLLPAGEKLLLLLNRSVSLVDGSTLRVLATPVSDAIAFTANADGTEAAFLRLSGEVILCDLASNCGSRRGYDVKGFSPSDLELSADGKSLVIIDRRADGKSHQIALFETKSWKQRKARLIDDVVKLAMAVDKDHVHLCTADTLRQYAVGSLDERVVRQFVPKAEHCRFFGERTVTSHADGAMRVWDETGTLVTGASARVDGAWRMALGEQTLIAASDRGAQAWDITPYGRQNVAAKLLKFCRGNSCAYGEEKLIALDSGEVTSGLKRWFEKSRPLAISDSLGLGAYMSGQPRGLAAQLRGLGRQPRALAIATLQMGKEPVTRWPLPIDSEARVTVSISPDERYVAITKEVPGQKSTAIHDARDGRKVRDLPGTSVVFFAPGDNVLTFYSSGDKKTGVADDKVMIVPLENGPERPLPDVRIQSAGPASAAFSQDGRHLALAVPRGQNSVVKLFEWPALKSEGEELQHSANVTSVSFRSDGLALLTSTTEGTTHVWDLATQKEILRIPAPGRQSTTAVFTPSGRVAILDDSGLTVLPANPDDLMTDACSRVVENLTKKDWELFVGRDIDYHKTCPNSP